MYEFVSKKEVFFARNEIEPIIHKVQNYLRDNNILTFQYNLVGSASNHRYLVTRIEGGNKGFDMDYNLILKQLNPKFDDAKIIKFKIMEAFDKFLPKNYKREDSSSAITLKKIDQLHKKIIYSFDFAIVNYYFEDIKNPDFDDEYDELDNEYFSIERQEIILFNKHNKSYGWELRPIASDHRYMEQYVKSESYIWNELRDEYLKHKNLELTKKSRVIYYETLNRIYKKHFN